MRLYLVLASTTLLAACGGTGGSSGSIPLISTPTATPTSSTTPTGAASAHTFVKPTEAKTYVGIGGDQVFKYTTDDRGGLSQSAQIYAANTTTVRNSGISISYDPASAIFELKVADPNTGAATNTRFQDPASRTDFGGLTEPQWGAPKLGNSNVKYLQAGDGNPNSPVYASGSGEVYTFGNAAPPYKESGATDAAYQLTTLFYLKPGTETQYVTYAGYARNSFNFITVKPTLGSGLTFAPYEKINSALERGAFAYGEVSSSTAVPKTGSASYRGSMLATMIFNPTLDGLDPATNLILNNYYQWIEGSSKLDVDFLNNSFLIALNGKVLDPQFDRNTGPLQTIITNGASFTANGTGLINLITYGGFKGQFQTASFTNLNGSTRTVNIAGSTVDGAFYGPAGQEVGGGFRIVGGNPDERIDILGAFVGK